MKVLLFEASFEAPLFTMHSGGGLIALETAMEQPVRLLASGPAGGAIFAAEFEFSHSLEKVLSFDTGGTTVKLCLVEGGMPKTANAFEVARSYQIKKGSGMIVFTPVVEMIEIGTGGGSIASIDTIGRLQVGQASAGSEPRPACYDRGVTEPTVSETNLGLGRLASEHFAGGPIKLLSDASEKAIEEKIFAITDPGVIAISCGVSEMIDENMANAVRVHAVENGRDVENFTMIGFGGGASLQACRLCEKLRLNNLLIPPGAGVGSVIGFLPAPFSYEVTRSYFQQLGAFQASAINMPLMELEAEALTFVKKGAGKVATQTRPTAFMRYKGRGYEIPVVLPQKTFSDGTSMIFQTHLIRPIPSYSGRRLKD